MRHVHLAALVLFVCSLAIGAGSQKTPVTKARTTYATVRPILKICGACHKPSKPAHGLNLTTYAGIIKGDKSGKVVIPGQPAKSRLATVLKGHPQLMPPGGALAAKDIAKIQAWIKEGAKEK
jgi:hypothetical protein